MLTIVKHTSTLEYLAVHPDGYREGTPLPLLICLHGFGADMRDLAGLTSMLDRTNYVYLFPNAPLEVAIGPGYTGRAWHEPIDPKPAAVDQALAALDGFVREVKDQYPVPSPGQAVLMGFSQGGALSLRYGLPRPETFAGLGVLSGSLREAASLQAELPAQRSQRILVTHGTHDPLIPIHWAKAVVTFLESQGYRPLFREYPMGHEITSPVIADLLSWIHETLPPAS